MKKILAFIAFMSVVPAPAFATDSAVPAAKAERIVVREGTVKGNVKTEESKKEVKKEEQK